MNSFSSPFFETHVLIPFAVCQNDNAQQALKILNLPHLTHLLDKMQFNPINCIYSSEENKNKNIKLNLKSNLNVNSNSNDFQHVFDEFSLNTSYERAINEILYFNHLEIKKQNNLFSDGLIPFAAYQLLEFYSKLENSNRILNEENNFNDHFDLNTILNSAWAFITPCYFQINSNHVRLIDPKLLKISKEDIDILYEVFQPLLNEDEIQLFNLNKNNHDENNDETNKNSNHEDYFQFIAKGEVFRHLPTASLDRVIDRDVSKWLPRTEMGRSIRRLQSEIEMLLYNHPKIETMNQKRQQNGLSPINAFWFSGSGALDFKNHSNEFKNHLNDKKIIIFDGLRESALNENWNQWIQKWHEIDQIKIPDLLKNLNHFCNENKQKKLYITLCGERQSQTFYKIINENDFKSNFYNHLNLKTRFSSMFKNTPILGRFIKTFPLMDVLSLL